MQTLDKFSSSIKSTWVFLIIYSFLFVVLSKLEFYNAIVTLIFFPLYLIFIKIKITKNVNIFLFMISIQSMSFAFYIRLSENYLFQIFLIFSFFMFVTSLFFQKVDP
jgi:hypothetical protein